jgi:hypothetical protein
VAAAGRTWSYESVDVGAASPSMCHRNATADEVEKVMGFCTQEEHAEFLRRAPLFEDMLASDGIRLPKLWFSVSPAEQRTRFAMRQVDSKARTALGSSSRYRPLRRGGWRRPRRGAGPRSSPWC